MVNIFILEKRNKAKATQTKTITNWKEAIILFWFEHTWKNRSTSRTCCAQAPFRSSGAPSPNCCHSWVLKLNSYICMCKMLADELYKSSTVPELFFFFSALKEKFKEIKIYPTQLIKMYFVIPWFGSFTLANPYCIFEPSNSSKKSSRSSSLIIDVSDTWTVQMMIM